MKCIAFAVVAVLLTSLTGCKTGGPASVQKSAPPQFHSSLYSVGGLRDFGKDDTYAVQLVVMRTYQDGSAETWMNHPLNVRLGEPADAVSRTEYVELVSEDPVVLEPRTAQGVYATVRVDRLDGHIVAKAELRAVYANETVWSHATERDLPASRFAAARR